MGLRYDDELAARERGGYWAKMCRSKNGKPICRWYWHKNWRAVYGA